VPVPRHDLDFQRHMSCSFCVQWLNWGVIFHFVDMGVIIKKSLKIPKGQSESVYRRRTNNTMAKKKGQKDKQRSIKHAYKTKDRVTRIPLKTGGEFRCSGSVN
jgi:hypothetical protein